ncbi:hypothetical protein BLOT_009801, partial [Blomia tropicalis]
ESSGRSQSTSSQRSSLSGNTEIERKQLQTLHPATQIHKFLRWPKRGLKHLATSVCYTRIETHTSSGFVAYHNSETIHACQFLLPRACCNFQAELIAIKKCLEYIRDDTITGDSIIFSLAKIMAIYHGELLKKTVHGLAGYSQPSHLALRRTYLWILFKVNF